MAKQVEKSGFAEQVRPLDGASPRSPGLRGSTLRAAARGGRRRWAGPAAGRLRGLAISPRTTASMRMAGSIVFHVEPCTRKGSSTAGNLRRRKCAPRDLALVMQQPWLRPLPLGVRSIRASPARRAAALRSRSKRPGSQGSSGRSTVPRRVLLGYGGAPFEPGYLAADDSIDADGCD